LCIGRSNRRSSQGARRLCILAAATGTLFLTSIVGMSEARAESPIYGIAELRLGLYYPGVDEEEGLDGTPFEDIFGSSNRLLFEYEMGVHLFKDFGALGLSASAGYTSFGGNVIVEEA